MTTTIDIDTGGTFTDAVVRRGDEIERLKATTTPHDLTVCFSEIIEKGSEEFDEPLRDFLTTVDCIRYSTTLGTNAVIEREGAEVGILSTGDKMAVLDQTNGLIGDIVEQGSTRTIDETADDQKIVQQYNELAEELVENVSVSMSSADEEQSVRDTVESAQPGHLLGSVPLHLSTDITDDPNDERRFTTNVIDSYLHPKLGQFLYKTEDFLRDNGYENPLLIFCSDGTSSRVAKTTAIQTYNSGPSAGIEGVSEIADRYGESNAVALDIGGTTADVAVIQNGEIARDEFGIIEDERVSLPMRKLYPTGGGGGTIASVEDGELSLGPESAGANPGPACYGLGGRDATVTDADVASDIIDPDLFAGDDISLDADRAKRAIDEHISEPLGVSTEKAAYMIRDSLEQHTGEFISQRLSDQDIAPEDAVLVAYGGAGPTHACGIADYAGVDQVIVPELPSVFSAYSVGFSNVVHDYHIRASGEDDLADVDEAVDSVMSRAKRDMEAEGFDPAEVQFEWTLRGIVGNNAEELGTVDQDNARQRMENNLVEYDQVDIKLEAKADLPTHEFSTVDDTADPDSIADIEVEWTISESGDSVPTQVYDIRDVTSKIEGDGPAVLRGAATTYAVPPDWTFETTMHGHTELRKDE
jgi:N-methylhydantoinase A/acetophenone carboxylase